MCTTSSHTVHPLYGTGYKFKNISLFLTFYISNYCYFYFIYIENYYKRMLIPWFQAYCMHMNCNILGSLTAVQLSVSDELLLLTFTVSYQILFQYTYSNAELDTWDYKYFQFPFSQRRMHGHSSVAVIKSYPLFSQQKLSQNKFQQTHDSNKHLKSYKASQIYGNRLKKNHVHTL